MHVSIFANPVNNEEGNLRNINELTGRGLSILSSQNKSEMLLCHWVQELLKDIVN